MNDRCKKCDKKISLASKTCPFCGTILPLDRNFEEGYFIGNKNSFSMNDLFLELCSYPYVEGKKRSILFISVCLFLSIILNIIVYVHMLSVEKDVLLVTLVRYPVIFLIPIFILSIVMFYNRYTKFINTLFYFLVVMFILAVIGFPSILLYVFGNPEGILYYLSLFIYYFLIVVFYFLFKKATWKVMKMFKQEWLWSYILLITVIVFFVISVFGVIYF